MLIWYNLLIITILGYDVNEEKWLTVYVICDYLQVAKNTIYKRISTCNMPAHKVGKCWMFQKLEMDQWIKAGKAVDSK